MQRVDSSRPVITPELSRFPLRNNSYARIAVVNAKTKPNHLKAG
jgi:hypothetical protein